MVSLSPRTASVSPKTLTTTSTSGSYTTEGTSTIPLNRSATRLRGFAQFRNLNSPVQLSSTLSPRTPTYRFASTLATSPNPEGQVLVVRDDDSPVSPKQTKHLSVNWMPQVGGKHTSIPRDPMTPETTPVTAIENANDQSNSRSIPRSQPAEQKVHENLPLRCATDVDTTKAQSDSDEDRNRGLESPITKEDSKDLPTVRLIPHFEISASKPSLNFPIITRTLSEKDTILKIGRYSGREGQTPVEAESRHSTNIGFKSKVVSRRHCELWCKDGEWFIKDVKSSSGTYLNHVRLSPASTESRAFPVKDGDIVQLGVDFKGGEDMIFRCVKIRIECNRSWQTQLNNFNTSTLSRLRNLTSGQHSSTSSSFATINQKQSSEVTATTSECSICLNTISACQALFIAPCSHVWHFKCIRTLLYPSWPRFQCPNCRAFADLEADVEADENPANDEVKEDEATITAFTGQTGGEVTRSRTRSGSRNQVTRTRGRSELQNSTTHGTLVNTGFGFGSDDVDNNDGYGSPNDYHIVNHDSGEERDEGEMIMIAQ